MTWVMALLSKFPRRNRSGSGSGSDSGSDGVPRRVVPARRRGRLTAESRPDICGSDAAGFRAVEGGVAGEVASWRQRRLDRLTCTVFDTETTGLRPAGGDKVVSIGAVRVLNGRLLRQETYAQLVDPGRRVSWASRRIHGITDEMLAGQPRIGTVLPAFARFADDSVLVGHNVAFDLTFLAHEEAETGIAFPHPVLDTLLLARVVHPGRADHSLDAVAGRLGVGVLGRHTALGDAIVTAEIFLRLVALLAARGITTFGEAQDAARKAHQAHQARAGNALFESLF